MSSNTIHQLELIDDSFFFLIKSLVVKQAITWTNADHTIHGVIRLSVYKKPRMQNRVLLIFYVYLIEWVVGCYINTDP